MIILIIISLSIQSEFSQFEVDDVNSQVEITGTTGKVESTIYENESETVPELEENSITIEEDSDYNINMIKSTKIPLNWVDYYVEIGFILFMILYLITYINGRGNNRDIAKTILDDFRPICQNNFLHVGESLNEEWTQESENVYLLWCSGHDFINKCVVYLDLLKRHDLLSTIKQTIRPTREDYITILGSLTEMDKMVFSISRKDKITEMSKKYPDLAFFCSLKNHDFIPNEFACLTENSGLIPLIFDQNILALFKRLSEYVVSVHVSNHSVGYSSDLRSGTKTVSEMADVLSQSVEKTVSLTVTRKGENEISLIFDLFVKLCCKITKTKLSKDLLVKADKKRERLEEVLIKQSYSKRQENDQKRKDERRQRELESIHNDGKASKKMQATMIGLL